MKINISVLLIAALLCTGCSAFGGNKKGTSQRAGKSGAEMGDFSESDIDMNRNARFGDGSIPAPESGDGPFRDIYFDYDATALSPEALQDIEANASLLSDLDGIEVVLEGHCDERGTEEYNLALGEKRARSVKEALVRLGVSPQKIKTVSYGENLPVDTDNSELSYAKNRRVHFSADKAGQNTAAPY